MCSEFEWIRIQKWSAIIDCKLFYYWIVHYVSRPCAWHSFSQRLSWKRCAVLSEALAFILGKHYIVQINVDNGHTGYLICSKYSWFAVKQYLNCYKNYIKPQISSANRRTNFGFHNHNKFHVITWLRNNCSVLTFGFLTDIGLHGCQLTHGLSVFWFSLCLCCILNIIHCSQ